jgi:hypothetical protein
VRSGRANGWRRAPSGDGASLQRAWRPARPKAGNNREEVRPTLIQRGGDWQRNLAEGRGKLPVNQRVAGSVPWQLRETGVRPPGEPRCKPPLPYAETARAGGDEALRR